jgi:glycosyltransferase involved in cell wall biosynthesis
MTGEEVTMSAPALHSVVVPVFNEAEGIAAFHERCAAALAAIGDPYEIIYVDDGSTDASWPRLLAIRDGNSQVRLIRLSRNFGHQIAISAGLEYADGDTVTVIDADLQDPPEIIARMVECWREGVDIVYGIRTSRLGESWFKRGTAKLFYRVMRNLADVDMPVDVGDFRLLSRRATDALLMMPEHHRYVRGMVAWLGYDSTMVKYVRDPRVAGETKYPLGKMTRFALDGIMSFSIRPLRIATWVGLLASVAAFITAIVLIVLRLFGNVPVQGWTSLAVLILLASGVQLVTIGTLGEYIGRIWTEVRGRPLYLVRDLRGFLQDDRARGRQARVRRPSPDEDVEQRR